MKYLQSYHELNESNSSDVIQDLIKKFSKKIDSKKLSKLVISNKDLLMPYYNKYVKNGQIMADLILSDFKKFNFKANEGYWDRDYADDKNNHPVLRFLYKFFVRWPKSFVSGIWEIFHDTVIDTWRDSKFMSILMSILWIIVVIFTLLIGYLTYTLIEHSINGLDSGKVTEMEFVPAHYETHVHTISTGKTISTYTTTDWVPDAYNVLVVGENGREEIWKTYNISLAKEVDEGETIQNDDNWTWIGTQKEGE